MRNKLSVCEKHFCIKCFNFLSLVIDIFTCSGINLDIYIAKQKLLLAPFFCNDKCFGDSNHIYLVWMD